MVLALCKETDGLFVDVLGSKFSSYCSEHWLVLWEPKLDDTLCFALAISGYSSWVVFEQCFVLPDAP